MNEKIKEIATKVFKELKVNTNRPDLMIDAYVLELAKAIVFECSDIVREKAKAEKDPVFNALLKVTAVDMLEHFGL